MSTFPSCSALDSSCPGIREDAAATALEAGLHARVASEFRCKSPYVATGGEDFRLNGAGGGAGAGATVAVAVRSVLACGSRSGGGGLRAGLVMAAGMVPSAAGGGGGGDCAK